jgi:hypothetical protein
MFTSLSNTLNRLATRHNLILFALLFALVFFVFIPFAAKRVELASGQPTELLDMRLGYSNQQAAVVFESLGEAGRQAYAQFSMSADLIFPLTYGCFFSIGLTFLHRKQLVEHPARFSPAFLPLLGMLFDYFENFSLVALMAAFPNLNPAAVQAASLFTNIKWLFQAASASAFIAGLYLFFFHQRGDTKDQK